MEVWDTGPGIALDEQQLIFQEFRRGSAAGGQGLGLGLSIAQRMAASARSSVWGCAHGPAAAACSISACRWPVPPCDCRRWRTYRNGCLRVARWSLDNEPAALAALSHLLTGWGWLVYAARNAEQALAAPWRADLHILDFHLDGGQTGLEVWQQLQTLHADVPTVMLTADRDGELRQRLLDAGIGVLYKPLKPLALRQVMQRVVAGTERV